ncbi:MAG: formate/nitrite transporter family protein [Alphaproteobacteria bacterium]|nr:formate/nitrite transporter family protein [Alphaproteobacteria bacterium]
MIDAYSPPEIAQRVEEGGVRKATLPLPQTLILGLLGGAFIAFGAMAYTVVITGSTLGFGPTRLVGGGAFALGLILVLVAGAELFTGNTLIVMAWADGRISTARLLRNWGWVYVANAAGAFGCVVLVYFSGVLGLDGGGVARTAAAIAHQKSGLGFGEAFFRGILCNVLVCLAVWLSFATTDVASRILAILFPIAAFVALGFEHSVANMYLLPIGDLAAGRPIDLLALAVNLVPVTLGNIVGGGALVAFVYWLAYRRPARDS